MFAIISGRVFRKADIPRFQQAIKGFDKPDFREVISMCRSGFKTPSRAQSLCWTETSNPRNIPDIPAVGRFSPPFYPAAF